MKNKIIVCVVLSLNLLGCSVFSPYGTSNIAEPAVVPSFVPQVTPKVLWQTNAGSASRGAYLRLAPTITQNIIYTIDQSGQLTATSAQGNSLWQLKFDAAGKSDLASEGQTLAFVDVKAVLHVVSTDHGKNLWQATLSDQALAAPTFTPHLIIVKTIDGSVTAFDRTTGKELWQYQHDVPSLMLRASSPVVVIGEVAYVAFSDGQVVALNLTDGDELWSTQVAQAQGFAEIERLVDIDAHLIVEENHIYAATYQGQIAALARNSGKILWQQENSVYADITCDAQKLYAVNNNGNLTAYRKADGKIIWQQDVLSWHFLSGPVLFENNLVVGDVEGNLYYLKPSDGVLQGSIALYKKSNIINTPLVLDQMLIVIDTQGHLSAVSNAQRSSITE